MTRLFAYLRTFRRLRNYLGERLRALTPARAVNVLKVELARVRRKRIVRAYPYELIIDPSNICQLKCPLCPTGSGSSPRPRGRMSRETFSRAIDELAPHALHVYLHNWGEPLLHPDITDFIAYAKGKGLAVSLSTNLSYPLAPERADALLASGLDTLVVSLDGASAEAYRTYRKGGDFDLVMKNLRLLVERKKALRRKRPFIEWQFLVMKQNEHERERARVLADDIGVDNLAFGTIVLPFGSEDAALAGMWFTDEERSSRTRYDLQEGDLASPCWWLWRGTVVNWDGTVSPCCYVDEESGIYGNINDAPFLDIWNGAGYQAARGLFSGGGTGQGIVCGRCGMIAAARDERRDRP